MINNYSILQLINEIQIDQSRRQQQKVSVVEPVQILEPVLAPILEPVLAPILEPVLALAPIVEPVPVPVPE